MVCLFSNNSVLTSKKPSSQWKLNTNATCDVADGGGSKEETAVQSHPPPPPTEQLLLLWLIMSYQHLPALAQPAQGHIRAAERRRRGEKKLARCIIISVTPAEWRRLFALSFGGLKKERQRQFSFKLNCLFFSSSRGGKLFSLTCCNLDDDTAIYLRRLPSEKWTEEKRLRRKERA